MAQAFEIKREVGEAEIQCAIGQSEVKCETGQVTIKYEIPLAEIKCETGQSGLSVANLLPDFPAESNPVATGGNSDNAAVSVSKTDPQDCKDQHNSFANHKISCESPDPNQGYDKFLVAARLSHVQPRSWHQENHLHSNNNAVDRPPRCNGNTWNTAGNNCSAEGRGPGGYGEQGRGGSRHGGGHWQGRDTRRYGYRGRWNDQPYYQRPRWRGRWRGGADWNRGRSNAGWNDGNARAGRQTQQGDWDPNGQTGTVNRGTQRTMPQQVPVHSQPTGIATILKQQPQKEDVAGGSTSILPLNRQSGVSMSHVVSIGTTVKFSPVMGIEPVMKNGTSMDVQTQHFCISLMKEYDEKRSMEELRLEDYLASHKTGTATQAASVTFGGCVKPAPQQRLPLLSSGSMSGLSVFAHRNAGGGPPAGNTVGELAQAAGNVPGGNVLSWLKFDGFNGRSLPASTISVDAIGTTVKFAPVSGADSELKDGRTINIETKAFCISMMKEYGEKKSIEELRFEDYQASGQSVTLTAASVGSLGMFGQNRQATAFGGCSCGGNNGFLLGANRSPFGSSFGQNPFGQLAVSQPPCFFGPPAANVPSWTASFGQAEAPANTGFKSFGLCGNKLDFAAAQPSFHTYRSAGGTASGQSLFAQSQGSFRSSPYAAHWTKYFGAQSANHSASSKFASSASGAVFGQLPTFQTRGLAESKTFSVFGQSQSAATGGVFGGGSNGFIFAPRSADALASTPSGNRFGDDVSSVTK
ncbi:nuclear pore complex protein Nup98-Nup96-like isoform X2 [Paramacrobiotus metropolitanus]|uniref:nuclear pore complex protein Nup98-Nup96-like isoform X2 n=1 Tax=Paramacrobiotus metropolitanus TaxID=2943436 RepID=UPI002445FF38|nr:nuclear pore complex protein Nup98-Nup96-like isoform X2 [Paramacrobiotus metropolitanus]